MSSNEILDLLEYFNKQILENIFLNKENKDDKKIKMLVDECIRLNKVIKDAIEYMKSIEHEPDADMYYELGQYKEYTKLLNILKGEDK